MIQIFERLFESFFIEDNIMEKTYEKRKVEVYRNDEFIQCEMKDLEIGKEILTTYENPTKSKRNRLKLFAFC